VRHAKEFEMKRSTNQKMLALGSRAEFPKKVCSRTRVKSRADARRGVLLLVVLSLLMLFSMVAVTFVLLSTRHYETTRYAIRNEQTGENPQQLLDNVFAQCIRGTDDPHSVIGPHSLLEDLYGNDGIQGFVASAAQSASGLIDITISGTPTSILQFLDQGGLTHPIVSLSQIQLPGQYNGCVLTMIDGPAAGKSTRIVGWTGGTSITARVMPFDGTIVPAANNKFIINGRPFNGTGAGFNPYVASPLTQDTLLNAAQEYPGASGTVFVPYALLPNPVFFGGQAEAGSGNVPITTFPDVNYRTFDGIGGADEDYDAPDTQNMLLAYIPLNATSNGFPNLIPSLHRPDTIRYVKSIGANYTSAIERQALLRPHPSDHPGFPVLRSDANFNVTAPAHSYDVDNDGDGVTDSIWVDAGLPVRTAADGRMYKPMVAILCVDLDGRLNVNAHGNVAQANGNYSAQITTTSSVNDYFYQSGTVQTTSALPRGQGFGPAEINLRGLFTNNTDYLNLMKGATVGGIEYEGRYGEWSGTSIYGAPLPGVSNSGSPSADDNLASLKRYDVPTKNFAGTVGYGSPVDVWGRSIVGLDPAGQPVYSFLTQTGVFGARTSTLSPPDNELKNDPYAINLSRNRSTRTFPTTTDNFFSVAELERVLRKYDADGSSLPDRLRALLDPTGTSVIEHSKLITTDSWDVPVPPGVTPRDFVSLMKTQSGNAFIQPSASFLELVRARIVQRTGLSVADPQVTTILNNLISNRIIAPELLAGQKFNLNRPFGNGLDDNNNGIIDEPGESNAVPPAWSTVFTGNPPTAFDLNRNGIADTNEGLLARQDYAKQLYFLMMVLCNTDYLWAIDNSTQLSAANQRELTTRQIAQWAINVVDFRDPDSIMTWFRYDADPFDGWDAAPDLTTMLTGKESIIWGAEYPELLLTETLAFHDRRVEDLKSDDGIKDSYNTPDNSMMKDTDFDQRVPPQGSLFLELYSTRPPSTGQLQYPADLYTNNKLDLGKLSPAGAGSPYPVWRVAITASGQLAQNALDNVLGNLYRDRATFNPNVDATVGGPALRTSLFDSAFPTGKLDNYERLIWFTNAPPMHPDLTAYSVFYNTNAITQPPLLEPGQHAVIGPRQSTWVGTNRTNNSPPAQTITLNTTPPWVQFDTTIGQINCLNIICTGSASNGWAAPVGMSVSEPPLNAYYPPTSGTDPNFGPIYSTPRDKPLDSAVNPVLAGNITTGSRANFRYALLQRLADPTSPYNVTSNPYITVDWQPIDLTVFSGQRNSAGISGLDPQDASPPGALPFGSRQRGNTGVVKNLLWSPLQSTVAPSVAMAASPVAVFDFKMSQTMGYVNSTYGNRWTGAPASLIAYAYDAQPAAGNKPAPWLTWNNRPFMSEAEVLLVPCGTQEQMLRHFGAPTQPAGGATPYTSAIPASYRLPFEHLLNFRLSNSSKTPEDPNYARILDYLCVPSPYVGTETYLSPTKAPGPATGTPSLLPPYNAVSNFREPGKININTVVGPAAPGSPPLTTAVWDAIQREATGTTPSPSWMELVSARRGFAANTNVMDVTTHSSFFAQPFRSAIGAAYVLPGTLKNAGTPLNESDVTFLRESLTVPGFGLFQNRPATVLDYVDPVRNAYFHHQPLLRTRNLLTTRSNVYAIWITVGYFEVRSTNTSGPKSQYPDGYQLWGEMGSDTGEIKRHRAFYIYDRSIPVAFERGKDHNIADGILLKRFIE
jgi:hypothetical protein